MRNATVSCTFYVIMLKRQDGQVYADLAKTTQQIFLTEHEAQDALANLSCGSWHILQMQAKLERVINKEVIDELKRTF